jgi:hypothetical protein
VKGGRRNSKGSYVPGHAPLFPGSGTGSGRGVSEVGLGRRIKNALGECKRWVNVQGGSWGVIGLGLGLGLGVAAFMFAVGWEYWTK